MDLTRCAKELERLAAGDPTMQEADAATRAVADLLPDARAADLLDEVMQADVPGALRASAARRLVQGGVLTTNEGSVRLLLAAVGPPARTAIARGLHARGDHNRARGFLAPLMRAVHEDVREEAQLWYRIGPEEYEFMPTPEVIRDATREPGWLHRSWAAQVLVDRGEVDAAIEALDGVVGHWPRDREDGAGAEEAQAVVALLARHSDNPRARALLERARTDEREDVRIAAAEALNLPVAPSHVDLAAEEEQQREAEQAREKKLFSR